MIKRIVAIVLLAVALSSGAFGQNHTKPVAGRPESRGLYLRRQSLRFTQHTMTFLDFAHNHIEQDLTTGFAEAAREASTSAAAVGVLFSIYDQLSCKADRDMAWPLIKTELASQANRLDINARAVDHNNATYVKIPAVAAAAARMKQDIDELKEFLEKTGKGQQ